MHRKGKKSRIVFAAVLLLFLQQSAAYGVAPWKWRMSLIGEAATNRILRPSAIYIDGASERYYVVDTGNNRLMSFARDGSFLNAFNAQDSLKTPVDFSKDKSGMLWVIEKGRNSLTRINLKSKQVTPHILKYQDRIVYPERFEHVGDLFYVLDKASGMIISYNWKLQPVKTYSCSDCSGGFIDFTVHNGRIWGLSYREKVVYGFEPLGKIKQKILLDQGAIDFPRSLAFDKSGMLYLLDRKQAQIVVFDQKGRLKFRFLGPGHVREKLYYPMEIQFDPWGNLCVVDEGNGRVEIYSR